MLKEALEDYKRYKQDVAQNSSLVDTFVEGTGERSTGPWSGVRPGDCVLVLRDEYFPSDLLFLSSSNPEGSCYVETMNLDGETNLKLKKCVESTSSMTDASVAPWRATLECDAPNNSLYTFQGNLIFSEPGGQAAAKVSVGPANVLLRGSQLRNTEWVIGCAVYTGHDTKVMMNAMAAPSKRSAIERRLDRIIFAMLSLLMLMCTAGSIYLAQSTKADGPRMWYLQPSDGGSTNQAYDPNNPSAVGLYAGITQFILYGYLIPISLYVSIELVKVAQSMYFINFDLLMYDAASDTPALARTSNLNEELGQVATVLSDKTGTLTRNTMEFFKCSIAGVQYGAGVTDIERSVAERAGKPLPKAKPGEGVPPEKGFNFVDSRLVGPAPGYGVAWRGCPDEEAVRRFFQLLAVCHTVIPEGEATPEGIKYQAESPDEAAFVVAAKRLGFFFKKRTGAGVTVAEPPAGGDASAPPVDRFYEVLAVLEFNSTRKRMSVVVRDAASRQLMLLCKGADSVIYERLAAEGNPHRAATADHVDEYAKAGLRTLCLAWAPIAEADYEAWAATFFAAKTSLVGRDAKLDAAAELIEKDLLLIGATAIEDKLQEGVPGAIEHLAAAGVALWVLTGDKQDTAINIGMACSLLRPTMEIGIISLEELVSAAGGKTQDKALRERASASVGEQLAGCLAEVEAGGSGAEHALVIDGFGLTFALSDAHVDAFWSLASRCAAVICCRVSPLQKALVTGLVKSKGKVTLAIGDGANDVGMIQAAHIGVGISGQEGMQAVMAADFAIAQFRFLERLVLVHGRYNYKRISKLITYFFYKNMLFGFTIFWYNAFAFFSGQPCYNDYAMSCFNLFFTSLPIIVVAVLDQDVSPAVSHHFPQLYSQGQRNEYFTWPVIGYWAANGFFQSIIIFLACFWGEYRLASDHPNGQVMEMWGAGSSMYTIVVWIVTLQLALSINYFTALHHAIFWFSVALKYIFILIIGILKPSFSTGEARFHRRPFHLTSLFLSHPIPIPSVPPVHGPHGPRALLLAAHPRGDRDDAPAGRVAARLPPHRRPLRPRDRAGGCRAVRPQPAAAAAGRQDELHRRRKRRGAGGRVRRRRRRRGGQAGGGGGGGGEPQQRRGREGGRRRRQRRRRRRARRRAQRLWGRRHQGRGDGGGRGAPHRLHRAVQRGEGDGCGAHELPGRDVPRRGAVRAIRRRGRGRRRRGAAAQRAAPTSVGRRGGRGRGGVEMRELGGAAARARPGVREARVD